MPTALMFDVAESFIDSIPQHAKAWQNAFLDFGHDITFEDLQRQIGKGGDYRLPESLS